MQIWGEIGFNVLYLIGIWGLVFLMWQRRKHLSPPVQAPALRFLLAFFLLALGDSGHVGFRLWAHLQGNMEATFSLLGNEVGLIGLGVLSTSITVTLFYGLLYDAWRLHFKATNRLLTIWAVLLLLVRFGLMIPPQNEWNSLLSPQPWSTIRNIPFVLLGLTVLVLYLHRPTTSRLFQKIGWATLVSFGFYIPVVLFVEKIPPLGMLMIPKTLAYVAMAWFVYREWFDEKVNA